MSCTTPLIFTLQESGSEEAMTSMVSASGVPIATGGPASGPNTAVSAAAWLSPVAWLSAVVWVPDVGELLPSYWLSQRPSGHSSSRLEMYGGFRPRSPKL